MNEPTALLMAVMLVASIILSTASLFVALLVWRSLASMGEVVGQRLAELRMQVDNTQEMTDHIERRTHDLEEAAEGGGWEDGEGWKYR